VCKNPQVYHRINDVCLVTCHYILFQQITSIYVVVKSYTVNTLPHLIGAKFIAFELPIERSALHF
jgi:hypothetical protein